MAKLTVDARVVLILQFLLTGGDEDALRAARAAAAELVAESELSVGVTSDGP